MLTGALATEPVIDVFTPVVGVWSIETVPVELVVVATNVPVAVAVATIAPVTVS